MIFFCKKISEYSSGWVETNFVLVDKLVKLISLKTEFKDIRYKSHNSTQSNFELSDDANIKIGNEMK